MMYVVVAFDISSEKVRGKIRRYLRRLGLSMVNRSVYAGVGGYKTASLISDMAKKHLEEGDNLYIVVIRDSEYESSVNCTKGDCRKLSERKYEVL
ncbi:CRISPR-associated endonuclease Cas2 [Acidianus hospitalis]|uniref:CRISPR-associated endoribonuclease Cas2 n=1 Tax=Acidianus hospitalis TaxID=563177 RepID=A0A2T9X3D4_9CREN|nr:CRISPR-associated endonuclease Cas2 [Acidianus hospitalis]